MRVVDVFEDRTHDDDIEACRRQFRMRKSADQDRYSVGLANVPGRVFAEVHRSDVETPIAQSRGKPAGAAAIVEHSALTVIAKIDG